MIVATFLITLLLGYVAWRLLPMREDGNDVLLVLFLAWGVGVGVASQLALLSVLLIGFCEPPVIVLVEALIITTLWIISLRQPRGALYWKNSSVVILVFVLAVMALYLYLALHLPYGGYDAWSLWNYRAASIFRGGDNWMAVFHNQVQGKHPWLLPFFVVWGWSFVGGETGWIPLVTSVVMATITIGLLVSAIFEDVRGWWAIMAGLLLVSVPFFTWHSISQYASVFVAYYALATAVCFKKAEEGGWAGWTILAAIFLGFLASSKDEGIVLAILFLVVAWANGYGKSMFRRRSFWGFLALSSTGLFICEGLMRTGYGQVPFVTSLNQHIDFTRFFDLSQWKTLMGVVWRRILHHPEFGRMWVWLPFILLGLTQRFVRYIIWVLFSYFLIFFVLYVMATDPISWRLGVSLNRLFFHVMPLLIFSVVISVVRFAKE